MTSMRQIVLKRAISLLKGGSVRPAVELVSRNRDILNDEDVSMVRELTMLVNSRLSEADEKASERAKRGGMLYSEYVSSKS